MTSRKVGYIIFDVDGLLIDSEHVYTTVISSFCPQLTVVRLQHHTENILAEHGKDFAWDLKAVIMGRPVREAATKLLSVYPDMPLTVDSFIAQYDTGLARLWSTVTPLPGAQKLIQHLHTHGVSMALATGSRRKNYLLKTRHLQDLFACFGDRVVCGDDLVDGMRGKPAPDLFLMAAREKLGLNVGSAQEACTEAQKEVRDQGLVFEDGISGFQGAKRAGMSVIWVPDVNISDVEYSGIEQPDLIIKSLEEFVPEEWGLQPYGTSVTDRVACL